MGFVVREDMPRSSAKAAEKMVGVALCDMIYGSMPKKYVHLRGDEEIAENSWIITSDVPLERDAMLSMEPLSTPLPGRLGSYLLPRDAVLHWPHRKHTTILDFQTLLQSERQSSSIATAPTEDSSYQVAVCGEEEDEEDMHAMPPPRERKEEEEEEAGDEEEDYCDDEDEPSESDDGEDQEDDKNPDKEEPWLESDEEGDANEGPLCGAVVDDPPARSTRSSSRRR